MIEIGILKNFDSGTYRASVQLAGSLTTYFDDISVARNIPSGAMVVGNYVILAIPGGNPRDACVIATWPGGSPGGGAFLDLSDTPSSYEGQALKLVRVASGEDAVEFEDIAKTMAATMKAWLHLNWFFGSSGWTDSVTGSGYILRGPYYQNIYTGTTISSRASTKTTSDWVLNYNQAWVAIMPVASGYPLNNSIMWIGFLTTYNNPSDTEKHYGFKIINGSIYASCADGSNQTIEDTGIDLGSILKVLMLRPYYTGETLTKIEYYIDGVLKKTFTTNLPDGSFWIQFGQTIINTAAENKKLSLYPLDIFVY